MSDRIDDAFAAWREGTEAARSPAHLTDRVMDALPTPFAAVLWGMGRPALFAASALSVVLLLVAASSVRSLAYEAADYALSRAP
jgi:hypothetical protein